MTLFEQILAESNLLLEKQNDVTIEKIKDAIENQKKVSIMYNDTQPEPGPKGMGRSWRYILPVVYGELKNGKPAVRAYETVGSTKRGLVHDEMRTPDGNP